MTTARISLTSLLALCSACATSGLATESPIDAQPVAILVPKDVEGPATPLHGVALDNVDEDLGPSKSLPGVESSSIRDFFSVSSRMPTPGLLATSACRGDKHPDGHRFKSCLLYEARVAITDEGDQLRIHLTPQRVRAQKGRNAIFLPIDLPKFTVADWYRYISGHSVIARHKIAARFSPEAIKGNFDRDLRRLGGVDQETDAALRQFKDAYALEQDNDITTRVRAAFYPYREGALVELHLTGQSRGRPNPGVVDWVHALAAARAKLEKVVQQ